MDGTAAIYSNLEALKRILAGLVAMAGLGCLSSPLAGEDGSARRGNVSAEAQRAKVEAEPLAEPGEGSGSRPTLPRHLRLAILRLLRPAEAAARRLIIASARGLVVALPPPRKPRPKPTTAEPLLRRFGIAVVMSPADLARAGAAGRAAASCPPAHLEPAASRSAAASPELVEGPPQLSPAHAAPRILFPGVTKPFSLPPPPSPDDPIDATRLSLRLAALAAALDDLPGQAKRFARWKARHDARAESARPRPYQAHLAAQERTPARRPSHALRSIRQAFPATSARSTRFWLTPMRLPSTRCRTPTRHDARRIMQQATTRDLSRTQIHL